MNLANNIKKSDPFPDGVMKNFSSYFVTSDTDEIPAFNSLISIIVLDEQVAKAFPDRSAALNNLNGLMYFVRKTERLSHEVLVASFYGLEHFIVVKTDDSICSCTAPYLNGEISVQLRIDRFDSTD